MSICCADLQSLRYFQRIRLLGGEKGLYRQLSWPFICTTSTISQWLHGGELLFLSGAGIDCEEESLLALMRESIAKGMAGMVILAGEQYIPKIPQSLIDLSNETSFPLYEMPWNLKLIDVTQEISESIMAQREQSKKGQHFLEQLLFGGDNLYNPEEICEQLGEESYPLCFFAVVEVLPGERTAIMLDGVKSDIAHTLNCCGSGEGRAVFTMRHLNTVICFALAKDIPHVEALSKDLETAFETLRERNVRAQMRMGFGRIRDQSDKVQSSYSEAKKALRAMEKKLNQRQVLHYAELGIYRLFFEIKNQEEIKAYYRENLSRLIEADHRSGSNLVGTLRSFLYNNCNLLRTSQALYIHRNTLIYRINTIKELLDKDLDDAFVRHELFTSMMIGDFIEK